MIIKKLIMKDFRVFKGIHEIELSPKKSDNRPIVLFGGLNGSGKTSILTAVRLALYGRLAFSEVHSAQEYVNKLESLIHNDWNSNQGQREASITLTFTYNKDGVESEFTVTRSWVAGEKDKLSLSQDESALTELNYDQCQGFLNELIPSGIADLFFFDGEKISELAEDNTGKTLQSAVRRLLGLDLIEKLRNDLVIFLKRQASRETEESYRNQLTDLEEKSEKLGFSAENYRYAADLAKISMNLVETEIRKQEGLLTAQGGAFAASKAEEQAKVDGLIKDKNFLERSIRSELEGQLPYALAPNAIKKLIVELNHESQVKQANTFENQANAFFKHLQKSESFHSQRNKKEIVELLEKNLGDYLGAKPSGSVHFDISERELGVITHTSTVEASQSLARFIDCRKRLSSTEQLLEQAAANIDRAPDDEQLLKVFQKIRDLDKKRQESADEYKSMLAQAKQALSDQLDCSRKLQKMHDNRRSQHDANAAVINAERTLSMLEAYAESLTRARVKKLENNFELAYQRLARKKDLRIHAKINSETFDVQLQDSDGNIIDRNLLSAGEKQIYALSILDSLAKTSGRQLPVIIDTPLGRLDSQHRDTLIANYFPNASHQVIILSTDTEVHKEYFLKELGNSISHSYQIEFDEKSRSSVLLDGYFWSNNDKVDNYVA